MKIKKFLKQLFCKHNWKRVYYRYWNGRTPHGWEEHFECTKCGKIVETYTLSGKKNKYRGE